MCRRACAKKGRITGADENRGNPSTQRTDIQASPTLTLTANLRLSKKMETEKHGRCIQDIKILYSPKEVRATCFRTILPFKSCLPATLLCEVPIIKGSHCMAPPCCDAQCPCGGLGIVAQYRGTCQVHPGFFLSKRTCLGGPSSNLVTKIHQENLCKNVLSQVGLSFLVSRIGCFKLGIQLPVSLGEGVLETDLPTDVPQQQGWCSFSPFFVWLRNPGNLTIALT